MSEKRDTKKELEKDFYNIETYTSRELELDITKLENKFKRADIEIFNLENSCPSYEGRIFLNNPTANNTTKLNLQNGYVGSYYVFGHGGCVGDIGHCEVPKERRMFDYRPDHHLKPQYKRIIITEALRTLGKKTKKFTITIVPIIRKSKKVEDISNSRKIVKFEKIGIITYD